MTFEQLEKKYGKLERVDWKQHENGGGWVHKNATITDKVFVGQNAIVWSGEISGTARISGGVIYGGKWSTTPLFLTGSCHSLTNCKPGYIQIGCHCKTIDWWVKNYRDIGKKEGYTDEQIAEYGLYIELFKKIGK